jgi:hypothetical protein
LNWGNINQFNPASRPGHHGVFFYCDKYVMSLAEMEAWRRNPRVVQASMYVLCGPRGLENPPKDLTPGKRAVTYVTAPTAAGTIRPGFPIPRTQFVGLEAEDDLLAALFAGGGGGGGGATLADFYFRMIGGL